MTAGWGPSPITGPRGGRRAWAAGALLRIGVAVLPIAVLFLSGCDSSPSGPDGRRYDIVDLVGPEIVESRAQAINDGGQVTGYVTDAAGTTSAFLWQDGELTDLGTLDNRSNGYGINSSGDVAGWAQVPSGTTHAALWREGELIELGALEGHSSSMAFDIDDDGRVIGRSHPTVPEEPYHTVLWEGGTATDLGTTLSLHRLNNTGAAVGYQRLDGGGQRAVLWQDGEVTEIEIAGMAEGATSSAMDITDAGVVLVERNDGPPGLWQAGSVTSIGTFPGATYTTPVALNAVGQVVGRAVLPGVGTTAVLWEDGEWVDLGAIARETLGADAVNTSVALDVNASGQIVGARVTTDERWIAVLWDPR